ncbi:hypothetical protein H4R19_000545 [Coemansia spiralis]|nr:hypothetical protein H4R19_000545 [Coemansia spiralis]
METSWRCLSRDATAAYSTQTCQSNTGTGNRDYECILLGFDLPPTLPRKCVLRIPAVVGGAQYNLTVSATDNSWDEAIVAGANKAIASFQVAAAEWSATAMDIKYTCDKSIGNKLGLFVNMAAYGVAFKLLR